MNRPSPAMTSMLAGLSLAGCFEVARLDELEPIEPPSEPSSRVQWIRHLTGLSTQQIRAMDVADDGTVVAAGRFEGVLRIGETELVNEGQHDGFVAAWDAEGRPLWARQWVGAVSVTELMIDATGAIAVGGFYSGPVTMEGIDLPGASHVEGFVVSLDPIGHPVWARRLGGAANQLVTAVAIRGGDVLVGGWAQAELVYDGGAPDEQFGASEIAGFVSRLGENGDHQWTRLIGDGTFPRVSAVTFAQDGDVVIGGTLEGSATLDDVTLESAGTNDFYVARLDAAGTAIWGRTYGDDAKTCHDWCEVELAGYDDGDIALTSSFTGAVTLGEETVQATLAADVLVTRLERFGELGAPKSVWHHAFGDPIEQFPYGIAVGAEEATYVSGSFDGQLSLADRELFNEDYAKDVFLLAYDASGAPSWVEHFPMHHETFQLDEPYVPVVRTWPGGLVLASVFAGRVEIDGETLETPSSDVDSFIVMMKP